jgi:hypothetical protein
VYRAIERSGSGSGQPMGPMMGPRVNRMALGQPAAKGAKPPRHVFPASGDTVRLELRREKETVQFLVHDARLDRPRYLGQVNLGTNDIAAVKLFVSNRNGAEPLEATWRDLKIRADRLGGLGTTVHTVGETVVYAEPTVLENGILIVGGPPKQPPAAKPPESGDKPQRAASLAEITAFAPVPAPAAASTPTPAPAPTPTPTPAAAPAPGASPATPAAPKARIPLADVESIHFERTAVLSARFLGQTNVDFTSPAPEKPKDTPDPKAAKKEAPKDDALAPPPGTTVTKVPRVNPEKNGIADIGLALAGLRSAKIKQVTVNCQLEKGPSGWRLDTSDSHDWPLVLRRSGTEPWAELYLEPPPADTFEKEYRINVVYDDGQNGNATVKAAGHTDPKRAVDPKGPSVPPPGATLYLTGDEKLHGTLDAIGPESIRLVPPWKDQAPLEIPLARVIGVHLSLPDRKESPESFAKRLKARTAGDLLLARAKDGEILALTGLVEGMDGDRLQFRYQERSRTLALSQVEGWVMAARPDPRASDDLRARVSLFGGLAASGVFKDLDTETWTFQSPWGQALKLPAAEIQDVRFRGGAMTHLCDLEPSKIDETPFFGHRMPWRRDLGLIGEPLSMSDQKYEHGLAVHSRCHLTYDLGGRYGRFEAVLGFDDSAGGRGRVDCRVVADGKALFARQDFRASEPPVVLSLPLAGAEQLRLEVDFGPDQDTGDRVIWANPRLFRAAEPATGAAAGSAR